MLPLKSRLVRPQSAWKGSPAVLVLALTSAVSRPVNAEIAASFVPIAEQPAARASAPLPASAPPLQVDSRPIRAQRRWAIAGEAGWNGLAGLGANFTFHPSPYLAFDTGLGLGLAGLKAGLRARANFLTSAWTPVLGLGILYESGASGAQAVQSRGDSAVIKITASPYEQIVGGVTLHRRRRLHVHGDRRLRDAVEGQHQIGTTACAASQACRIAARPPELHLLTPTAARRR